MKKILVSLVLLVFASSAFAIDINSGMAPDMIAPDTIDSTMVSATSVAGLPTSIIAFTGSGDEFWVQFWGNWDDSQDNVFEWSSLQVAVPGAMTLPRISTGQNRAGTWYTGWKFYCLTDSISIIGGYK